jgi:hypothetical protein
MTTLGKILIAGCILTSAAAHSPRAWAADADSEGEARERFNRAVELYNAGDFSSALAELNRAAALRPSYKLQYAIAQVRAQMNDYVGAVNAYAQYLQGGGKEIDEARRTTVQKEIRRLEQRVATLSVRSNVPGCDIYLDEVPVGTTPLAAALRVNSGQHRITLRHPEYVPQSRKVSLAGGVREDVAFMLVPIGGKTSAPPAFTDAAAIPPSAPPPPPPSPVEPTQPERKSIPWIGWVATSVLAVGAGVTGVIALSKDSDLGDRRERLETTREEVEDGNRELRGWAIATDALIGSAVIVGGISLWLTLHRDETGDSAPASAASWQLGVSPRGMLLKSQF